MILLAVDPGKAGGFASWNGALLNQFQMPETQGDLVNLIRAIGNGEPDKVAVIEEVVVFFNEDKGGEGDTAEAQAKAQGRKVGMAIRRSKMMTNYGFLLGALMMAGWRVETVRPQQWQKSLSLGSKKDSGSDTAWKNKLKSVAQRLYPQMKKVTLGTADALLILEYARRHRFNLPTPVPTQGELV